MDHASGPLSSGISKRTTSSAKRRPNPTGAIAHIAFVTCICLQRVGIPFGDSELSISLPIFLLLAIWMIASGRARVSPRSALLYLALAFWAVLCGFCAVLLPDPRVGFSIFSLLELLALYMLLTVRPAGDFDAGKVREIFLFYARLAAVAGILQFALQFVGVRIFSFGQYSPELNKWLLEKDFAWNPVLHYGSTLLRSNGFFLLEPSIFSQVLGLAILLDYFILGRKAYLPLYLIAYITSFSGTGLLSLTITLVLIGMTSLRNSGRIVMIGIAGAVALGLFSLALPAQVAYYVGRLNELTNANTSGHARYVAQLGEFQAFAGETRNLIGYGPGATIRSRYWTAGSGNPALQLFVDYGIGGLALFYTFLIATLWRTRYAAMSIMLLINFQLGGGYLLFAPIILLTAALGVWGAEGASVQVRGVQRRWRPTGRALSLARTAG